MRVRNPQYALVLGLCIVLGAALGYFGRGAFGRLLSVWYGNSGPWAAGLGAGEQAQAQGEPKNGETVVTRVVDRVGPCVVKITTVTEETRYTMFMEPVVQRSQGLGSGVIYKGDGHILTNDHVVKGATDISVVLPDKRRFRAALVGADPITDLAVLRIRGKDLPVAKLGDSGKLKRGQLAIAIGNPYGFDNTVTSGVVSATNRPLEGTTLTGLIQTDTPINPGNSGGPLLDSAGRVIGINTAILPEAQSIGFAIPINKAKAIAARLEKDGRILRPFLGVELVVLNADVAERLGLPLEYGLGIKTVADGSPAARAGIVPGDIVTAVNGKRASEFGVLSGAIKRAGVGGVVNLTILREDRRLRARVKLGSR